MYYPINYYDMTFDNFYLLTFCWTPFVYLQLSDFFFTSLILSLFWFHDFSFMSMLLTYYHTVIIKDDQQPSVRELVLF